MSGVDIMLTRISDDLVSVDYLFLFVVLNMESRTSGMPPWLRPASWLQSSLCPPLPPPRCYLNRDPASPIQVDVGPG